MRGNLLTPLKGLTDVDDDDDKASAALFSSFNFSALLEAGDPNLKRGGLGGISGLPNCSFTVPNWNEEGVGMRGVPKMDFCGGVPNTEAAVGKAGWRGAEGALVSMI